jgi:hypothetical protein
MSCLFPPDLERLHGVSADSGARWLVQVGALGLNMTCDCWQCVLRGAPCEQSCGVARGLVERGITRVRKAGPTPIV